MLSMWKEEKLLTLTAVRPWIKYALRHVYGEVSIASQGNCILILILRETHFCRVIH